MPTESDRLNALQLPAFSFTDASKNKQIINAERPACVVSSTSTVAQPDPHKMSDACLFTRYEVAAAINGPDGNVHVIFLAPGQLIPAFRKDGNNWIQVLNYVEFRAYTLPMWKNQAWVTGDKKPLYNELEDLPNRPASRDLRMARPGGETRLRPHPKIPGALPMKRYEGPSVAQMLDMTPMQVGDFIRLFGDMPLINMTQPSVEFPFRFVTGNLSADYNDAATTGLGNLFQASDTCDEVAANPLTGGMVGDLKDAHLPISFTYAEDHFDDFDSVKYDAGVQDALKGESWIFIQHRLSPYRNTNVEDALGYTTTRKVTQTFDRSELPPGVFLTPWDYKQSVSAYDSLAPLAFDQARRFKNGQYNEFAS